MASHTCSLCAPHCPGMRKGCQLAFMPKCFGTSCNCRHARTHLCTKIYNSVSFDVLSTKDKNATCRGLPPQHAGPAFAHSPHDVGAQEQACSHNAGACQHWDGNTKHLVPGPAWSPELGRREPALCLQIEKAQFQLPASQAQPIAQGCRSEQLLAANMQGCKTFHANRGSSQAFFVMLMAYARIKLWQKHGVGVAQECMCLRCKLLDSPSALTEHVSGVWAVSVTQGKDTAAASMVLQKA